MEAILSLEGADEEVVATALESILPSVEEALMPRMELVKHVLSVASVFSPWVAGTLLHQKGLPAMLFSPPPLPPPGVQPHHILGAALRVHTLLLADKPLRRQDILQLVQDELQSPALPTRMRWYQVEPQLQFEPTASTEVERLLQLFLFCARRRVSLLKPTTSLALRPSGTRTTMDRQRIQIGVYCCAYTVLCISISLVWIYMDRGSLLKWVAVSCLVVLKHVADRIVPWLYPLDTPLR